MKKKVLLVLVMVAFSMFAFAQKKTKKLSKQESARMTADQRFVHETNRKKGKKKDVSLKKKVRIEEKQDRKARKLKNPGRRKD